MTLADYVEIRRRINSINGVEFDQLKKLLKALYLLGVDIGQMRGEMCESEKERANEVYGPTGDDVREDYVCLPYSKETIQVIFFQIPILRKRLKGLKKEEKPSSRLVALPKEGDIWTLELYNYFKEAGDKYVFPFTREDAQGMVAKAKPFDSLKYLVKERKDTPIHEVDFTMRYLPDVREQELKKRYKFEVGDLQAYGLRV